METISDLIRNEIGALPTYGDFLTCYLKHFRELYKFSSLPSDHLTGMFYDDFIKEGEIIGY